MQHRPSILDESYISHVSARKRKINCYLLVENNLLAHLQGYMRRNQKLILAIERARVAKPGCETDQSRLIMKKKMGVPSLRYKLSHHCIVVMLPNLDQRDQTQQCFSDGITYHMCATSWLWVPAMRFLAARSAFSGSTRYAVVRPVIKPCPYCKPIISIVP